MTRHEPKSQAMARGPIHYATEPSANPEPVFISEQELARLTTLSRTTLQTMRREGGGPPFARLGRRVVYRLADVDRWIHERTLSQDHSEPRPDHPGATTGTQS